MELSLSYRLPSGVDYGGWGWVTPPKFAKKKIRKFGQKVDSNSGKFGQVKLIKIPFGY